MFVEYTVNRRNYRAGILLRGGIIYVVDYKGSIGRPGSNTNRDKVGVVEVGGLVGEGDLFSNVGVYARAEIVLYIARGKE